MKLTTSRPIVNSRTDLEENRVAGAAVLGAVADPIAELAHEYVHVPTEVLLTDILVRTFAVLQRVQL